MEFNAAQAAELRGEGGGEQPAQAARAAFDALPFIVEADETTVVTVDAGPELVNSASQLAAALARHGSNASVIELAAKGRPVADVIAAQVQMSAADLLVMGAYGHSRLREFLFGGVTRSLALDAHGKSLSFALLEMEI